MILILGVGFINLDINKSSASNETVHLIIGAGSNPTTGSTISIQQPPQPSHLSTKQPTIQQPPQVEIATPVVSNLQSGMPKSFIDSLVCQDTPPPTQATVDKHVGMADNSGYSGKVEFGEDKPHKQIDSGGVLVITSFDVEGHHWADYQDKLIPLCKFGEYGVFISKTPIQNLPSTQTGSYWPIIFDTKIGNNTTPTMTFEYVPQVDTLTTFIINLAEDQYLIGQGFTFDLTPNFSKDKCAIFSVKGPREITFRLKQGYARIYKSMDQTTAKGIADEGLRGLMNDPVPYTWCDKPLEVNSF
jgi:hypothetical protein